MLMVDGHLDLAMNALLYERDQTLSVPALRQREQGQPPDKRGTATVSLPELAEAGVCLVAATLIARCKPWVDPLRPIARCDLDWPDPLMAHSMAHAQLAYYQALHQRGYARLIRTRAQLDEHLSQWRRAGAHPTGAPALASSTSSTAAPPVGIVLAMEGADPILQPDQIHHWQAQGLAMIALAHFGHARYAAGTPSRDPASAEQDGPLTALGRTLLAEMAELPIALDLSHLAEAAFFEAIDLHAGPLCATHTNCRALAPGPRQFSDLQIKRIVERGGVIGIALHRPMIRPQHDGPGQPRPLSLRHVAEHVDHVCQVAGSAQHVALGSDLDGGFGSEQAPDDLNNYRDIHQLAHHLAERGMSDADVARFFHQNWIELLQQTLPGESSNS